MAIRRPSEPTAPVATLPGATQAVAPAPVSSTPATKVDYKAEEKARIAGQVRMHCIEAALASPAGPAFAPTAEAYEAWVVKLADLAFAYTFKGE